MNHIHLDDLAPGPAGVAILAEGTFTTPWQRFDLMQLAPGSGLAPDAEVDGCEDGFILLDGAVQLRLASDERSAVLSNGFACAVGTAEAVTLDDGVAGPTADELRSEACLRGDLWHGWSGRVRAAAAAAARL